MADPTDEEELDRTEERLGPEQAKNDELGRAIEGERAKTQRPDWRPDHANDGGVI
jgi:hypothetical protein